MDPFWPTLFAGLAVVVVVAAVSWAWKRVRVWWANQMAADDEAKELADGEELATLREQVADRARKLGIRMPVSSSGNKVKYADGHATLFIPDFQMYRSAMENRRVDILNTVNNQPPTPLSSRNRAWLIQWLEEHPEP